MIRALAPLLLALPAAAQDLATPEAATLPRLIESACLDLAADHTGCEQAILLASGTEPDLADLIVLTDRRSDPAAAPLLVARGIAFNGAMWGMAPSLAQAENGSLLLRSEQTGIGRFPWMQTLTLAWREGRFVVAGFTWDSYDRARGGSARCDVNLLSGAFVAEASVPDATGAAQAVHAAEGRMEPLRIAAADWTHDALVPAPCTAAAEALFAATD
ncbi:hypothetical protein [Roseicyclus persicicus]|uniref:Uncharacterized protein n=1 Tax=Roseicyclus persicicus TaxID=2650661 RepID=A0A7X6JXZ2_9RHOB|nr:hypothetical protein [Roseibacterium persicicum]NKX43874.1 hypothetical protein [Roseibacterium persicicum]